MFLTPLWAGVSTSVLHVLTGPDHLAAVTPIAIYEKKNVWRIGFLWGIGHILGMLIIGGLFFAFREFIPVDRISAYSEQLVAFVLIGLGIWAIYTFFRYNRMMDDHPSEVDLEEGALEEMGLENAKQRKSNLAILGIGIIHGLAGVSHFILLLPTLSYDSNLKSITYIVGFAAGSIMAMTFYSWVISLLTRASGGSRFMISAIRLVGGLFAIIIGIYWLYASF